MLIICIGSLVFSSFSLSSSFLNSNVKYAHGQESPAAGGELLCPEDFPFDVTTGVCADGFPPRSIPPSEFSQPPPEEIQMDTNGDGIVDAADNPIPTNETNTSSTPPPEEIQMDTNGDGIVDAADNPIPTNPTNTSSTPPPEEIQMDTNGDGIVDAPDKLIPTNATNTSGGEVSLSNLPVSGQDNSCNSASAPLSIKAKGSQVTNLQNILIKLGYSVGLNGADSDFGPNTQAAVNKFQQDKGLTPNGVVDSNTWKALCSSTIPPASTASPTQTTIPSNSTNYEWIHDPSASVLDKVNPSSLANEYRNFKWDRYDFPGANKPKTSKFPEQDPGPNEEKAKQMLYVLRAQLLPEHRATLTDNAVFCVRTLPGVCSPVEVMSQKIWDHILDPKILISADKQGHKLNKFAQDSFAKMQAAAKKDGVELDINNSDRPCGASQASVQRFEKGSQTVIAGCPNSHNFGLAIDFNLNQDDWPLPNPLEVSSAPFKNIINMMQSPVYKWLYLNAKTYHWYPYVYEPWHWEFNPPGFRNDFFAGCNCDPKSSPAS